MSQRRSRIVSVSTVLFDGYSFQVAAAEIARAGARHVEPAFIRGYVDFAEGDFSDKSAASLGRLINAEGLSIHALSAHLDLSSSDAGACLVRRIAFAAGIGASFLISNSGPAAERRSIAKVIEEALPYLETAGVTLALENPGHGQANLTGTAADAAAFVRTFGSQHLCFNHDAGNIFTYSGARAQPADDISYVRDVVRHVHLKDVRATPQDLRFCALGDGDVAFPPYWRMLDPELPVTIEIPLRLRRPGWSNPVRAAEPVPLPEIRAALTKSLTFVADLDR